MKDVYRERNFCQFFADRLFEDSPEVDAERCSWRDGLASVRLSDDAQSPPQQLLLLLLLLLFLLLRARRQRRRNLQSSTAVLTNGHTGPRIFFFLRGPQLAVVK